MADLTRDNKASGFDVDSLKVQNSVALAAATVVYADCMVFVNASGYAIGAGTSATNAYFCAGVAAKQVDNSSGSAGAKSVDVHNFAYLDNDTTNPITRAMLGRSFCYAVDNHTVGSSSLGGSLCLAGVPLFIDPAGKVAVSFNSRGNLAPAFAASPYASPSDFRAHVVATNLAALTFTAGTFSADANGALATQDGITVGASGIAAGDVIIFPAGTIGTGVVSAANSGPWLLTSVGGASAKFTGIRPPWYAHGSSITPRPIEVAAGTLYGGTSWKPYADVLVAGTPLVVGTGDPKMMPRQMTQQITLVAGTLSIANFPVASAAKLGFACTGAIGGTPAVTTTNFAIKKTSGITAGGIGTAAVVVEAQSVAGTIVNTDVSVLNVTLINNG